jgi:glyoxylase-like metal-dependent hydrolase (beta-lactamase superfamily II)
MLEELTKNLYVYYPTNIGSNVYILIGKKVVLIDTSLKASSADLKEALASLKLKPSDVELILHTHGHADHFGCDFMFKNAEKRMHESDAKYVELSDARYTCSNLLGQDEYPSIDSVLHNDEVIDIKPFSLRVIHTPGHTAGSVCFYDEGQKLLFSGDTLFKDACGRTDLQGGSEEQLIESLLNIKFLDFEILLPGHGVVFKGDQRANIDLVLKSLKGKFL